MASKHPHTRICLIPNLTGVGGMVSFRGRLVTGLEQRGIQVSSNLADTPYDTVLIIGGTRNLVGLWRAKQRGARVVQRLDGMNWIHRKKRTGWRHFIRAEYGNLILSLIRSKLADQVIYQSEFAHQWWERIYGKSLIPWAVVHNGVDLERFRPDGTPGQPGLIVVDRAVTGPYQNYLTPENQIPGKLLPYPWESCMIMGGGWSYSFNAKYRSTRELIHMLADIVAKGGNLLLNIAPSPEGTWDDAAYERLKGIGAWMRINGEAIYGSRPLAPYRDGANCLTQSRQGAAYAIYLTGENEKSLPARITIASVTPATDARISLLGAAGDLPWELSGGRLTVRIPESIRKNPPCEHAWVLKISALQR